MVGCPAQGRQVIRVQNIYHMLAYAFRVLRGQGYADVATEEFDNAADLCAEILARGVRSQLKRGLGREYVEHVEALSSPRGKIEVTESVKTRSVLRRQLVCAYDDLSVDTDMNRILKATMALLVRSDIGKGRKRELKRLRVKLVRDRALDIQLEDGHTAAVKGEKGDYSASAVILATGGVSYPATGSTGDGFRMAESLGHTVTPLRGSLVPLRAYDCAPLQGLSLRNVALTVYENNKKIHSDFGEMLFTHFGVSGPLILSASAHMRHFDKKTYRLSIDLKPALDEQMLDKRLLADFEARANSDYRNVLGALLPQKMIDAFVDRSLIPPHEKVHDITRAQRETIRTLLKRWTVDVAAPMPVENAIITSGGVKVGEIDPKTMASKKVAGLYFAGEMIDVDAYTGGYNLQIAWATGKAAGEAAADALHAE